MTGETRVIGIDPGPTPGMVLLRFPLNKYAPHVVQCNYGISLNIFRTLLELADTPTLVQIERFVIGRGSMKSGPAGAITRDLVGQLEAVAEVHEGCPVRVVQRSASTVKAWATDERLKACGLLRATVGMTHARDAARHALYLAVKDCGWADPLSKKARVA